MVGNGALNVEASEVFVWPNVKTDFVGAADVLAGWLCALEIICVSATSARLGFEGVPEPAPT